ncbi:MAG: hypothetical protein WC649_10090 [Desulfobacteria bacterium]
MKCERCGSELKEGDIFKIRWEKVCEECYMDNTLPKHPCDPFAQMNASNIMEITKKSPMEELSERQRKIYEFIKEKARVTPMEIAEEFGLRELDLMQDFIVLRRLGLAKGTKDGDTVYYVVWN